MTPTAKELYKKGDYDRLPISKKFMREGRDYFVLISKVDAPKFKVREGDFLLFELRDPKPGDISTFNTFPNAYNVGVYKVSKDKQQGLVSIKDGRILVVLAPGEKFISGVLVRNLGNPNQVEKCL